MERADSGAIAAVHDAALVHIMVRHHSVFLSCAYARRCTNAEPKVCAKNGSHVCQTTLPAVISVLHAVLDPMVDKC